MQLMKLSVCVVLMIGSLCTKANSIKEIDDYIEQVMLTFHIPGAAVGVIKDGKVVHMRGYGVADITTNQPVNEQTVFKIASNTKAFTAMALAILVEQGKMKWTDKVRDHLPDFKMFDGYATQEFTVIDLLTHRSGLALGSGDLMLWPEPTNFSRSDVVHNLRYLKPAYGFREKYAYDNTLYIVAGEVASAVAGKPWEQLIEDSIFAPLELKHCHAGGIDTKKIPNVVAPHLYLDDVLQVDEPNRIRKTSTLMAAAGGIKCSVEDVLTWIGLQLNGGESIDGKRLVSEQQAQFMWRAVTPMSVSQRARELDGTNFRGYALGWRVNDFKGQWMVGHTGTLSGAMSQIILLPQSDLGVVVLLNQSTGYARNAMIYGVINYFLGDDPKVALSRNIQWQQERQAWLKTNEAKQQGMVLPPEQPINVMDKRLGKYIDPWFGEVTMLAEGNEIVFRAQKVPRMIGSVYQYDDTTWWVKWHNRSFDADSWIRFSEKNNSVQMTMERIAEDSDWSMSVQDLNFTQQK